MPPTIAFADGPRRERLREVAYKWGLTRQQEGDAPAGQTATRQQTNERMNSARLSQSPSRASSSVYGEEERGTAEIPIMTNSGM